MSIAIKDAHSILCPPWYASNNDCLNAMPQSRRLLTLDWHPRQWMHKTWAMSQKWFSKNSVQPTITFRYYPCITFALSHTVQSPAPKKWTKLKPRLWPKFEPWRPRYTHLSCHFPCLQLEMRGLSKVQHSFVYSILEHLWTTQLNLEHHVQINYQHKDLGFMYFRICIKRSKSAQMNYSYSTILHLQFLCKAACHITTSTRSIQIPSNT